MKPLRSLAISTLLILVVVIAVLWWNQPARSDMSDYAPADALVYIETNSLTDVMNAIQTSEVWKTVSPVIGTNTQPPSKWALIASRSGIAPIQAVLSSRAQMAVVVLGINTAENEEVLHVKPEVALIVETHTAKWRMKSAAVSSVKQLAEFAYGASSCTERSADVDYVECVETRGSRKIIGAIDGSVVIVGNSDKAVASCLEVRRGQRPSLHTDPELGRLRTSLKADSSLAFGYISQTNSARLFSLVTPILIGRPPGDGQLEQLLAKSANKILRGIAWTSKTVSAGIEDDYQISLDPDVVKRLEPAFETTEGNESYWKSIPNAFRSMTFYRSKDPQAAWLSLNSAMALKLDAVSSVIFGSLLKSGLSGYGIDDPRTVMSTLSPPIVTLRPALGEGSMLLASVKDEAQLRNELTTTFVKSGKGQILTGFQSDPAKEKEFTALFLNGSVIIGKTEDLVIYIAQLRANETLTPERLQILKALDRNATSGVVTYTNDRSSLTAIINALAHLKNRVLSETQLEAISSRLTLLEISCTESSLNSNGIERKTQSAFGQFGSLLSYAQSASAAPTPR